MYEMLINIIIIYISILFFFNIYIFFNYKQKTDFFVTTLNFEIFEYNIDSQSFENIYILNIFNNSYRTNYILQCAENILYF